MEKYNFGFAKNELEDGHFSIIVLPTEEQQEEFNCAEEKYLAEEGISDEAFCALSDIMECSKFMNGMWQISPHKFTIPKQLDVVDAKKKIESMTQYYSDFDGQCYNFSFSFCKDLCEDEVLVND